MSTDDMYWASRPADELAEKVVEKVDKYDDYLRSSGLLSLWQRSAEMYYKGISENYLKKVGENKEFTALFVNHFRNILRHSFVSTTATRPAWEPRVVNTDFKSRSQIAVCEGMLDYYFDEKHVERKVNRAAEYAVVIGEGALGPRWNKMKGDIVTIEPIRDPETGEKVGDRPIYEGDVDIAVHSPVDVIRDVTKETFAEQQWLIIREPANRWDLIAAYPQFREEILQAAPKFEKWRERRINPMSMTASEMRDDSDDVQIYTFYHDRTPAMPLGRVSVVLDNDTVLSDQTMEQAKYKERPVLRIAASDVEGAPFGYTFAFDLLAIQDLCNLLYSTVATNQSNFGVQCLQGMKGSGIDHSEIITGLRLILYDSPQGRLEPLELAATPKEVFEFMQIVEGVMETLSAVNSVVRGNPEASLKSGNALALVQAQHSEFTRDYQQSYYELVSDTGTAVVRLFQNHAESPRFATIVGKMDRSRLQSLKGANLDKIDRVRVEMGDHFSRTPVARMETAKELMQAGLIENAQQYLIVKQTGKLDPLLRGPQATLDLIQAENEQLLEGKNPPVIITDNHVQHITEHLVVGADTEARLQQPIMDALMAHVQMHVDNLKTMDPQLAALLGQPVLNQPPMPGDPNAPPGMSGEGGTPPGGEPPPGGSQPGDPAAPPATPEQAQATGSAGVPFPTIAGSEQQWSPAGM